MGSPRADAGIIQITDFTTTNGTISALGSQWQWDQANRELLVAPNTPSDYLFQQLDLFSKQDIVGAKSIRLAATWTPFGSSPDGEFIVRLYYEGDTKADALFRFGDFAGGKTVTKALNWTTNPNVSTVIDQWQIIGNGNSTAVSGVLAPTNMSVSTEAVPEIDPASMSGALAMVWGALGLLERRRLRVSIS